MNIFSIASNFVLNRKSFLECRFCVLFLFIDAQPTEKRTLNAIDYFEMAWHVLYILIIIVNIMLRPLQRQLRTRRMPKYDGQCRCIPQNKNKTKTKEERMSSIARFKVDLVDDAACVEPTASRVPQKNGFNIIEVKKMLKTALLRIQNIIRTNV